MSSVKKEKGTETGENPEKKKKPSDSAVDFLRRKLPTGAHSVKKATDSVAAVSPKNDLALVLESMSSSSSSSSSSVYLPDSSISAPSSSSSEEAPSEKKGDEETGGAVLSGAAPTARTEPFVEEKERTFEKKNREIPPVKWKDVYGRTGGTGIFKNCSPCKTSKVGRRGGECCRCFYAQMWYYAAGALCFCLFGVLGAAFARTAVYAATGSFLYELGRFKVGNVPHWGDLVVSAFLALSAAIAFVTSRYLFKRWTERIMLITLGVYVAKEDVLDKKKRGYEYHA
jgi:hypothetical protein